MPALSKFLVLLALFLLASRVHAFTSLSSVAGDQIRINHLPGYSNKRAFQQVNQVANQRANQPMIKWLMIKQLIEDWNGMLSFLISFHQNKESIVYCKLS
jgi:hypothetical protein